MFDLISVGDAAVHLGVQPRRVRFLIKSGQLEAERIGRSWVIPMDSVRARIAAAPKAGRPLSPKSAWSLLALLEASDVADLERQDRWRVRRLLSEAPELDRWPAWLARRGEAKYLRVNPRSRDQFLQDERVIVSNFRGVPGLEIDLDSIAPVHISSESLDALTQRYRVQEVSRFESRNDDIRAIVVPAEQIDRGGLEVKRASAAVDLLKNSDPRVKAAAQRYLSFVSRPESQAAEL